MQMMVEGDKWELYIPPRCASIRECGTCTCTVQCTAHRTASCQAGLRRPRAPPQDSWPLGARLHDRDQTHHGQPTAEGRRSRVVTTDRHGATYVRYVCTGGFGGCVVALHGLSPTSLAIKISQSLTIPRLSSRRVLHGCHPPSNQLAAIVCGRGQRNRRRLWSSP